MPNKLQWKLFHFMNREGKLTKDWDRFSKMSEKQARKYLDRARNKKPMKRTHKRLNKNRRRVS